jgi:hypothetical protein
MHLEYIGICDTALAEEKTVPASKCNTAQLLTEVVQFTSCNKRDKLPEEIHSQQTRKIMALLAV